MSVSTNRAISPGVEPGDETLGAPRTAPPARSQELDARFFTTIEYKHQAYLEETFFREAWDDVELEWGDSALELLHDIAVIVFKPEAVVGRRLEHVMAFARDNGFEPIVVWRTHLDRHIVRQIWRYQWNLATTARVNVATAMYSSTDTILVVFRDLRPVERLPACVRLRSLKGSAVPELRRPNELRTVLGGDNCMLTFVHIPDEPMDIVREMAVFFDRPERRRLLRSILVGHAAGPGASADAGVADEVARLYRNHPPHSLRATEALERIESEVRHARRRDDVDEAALARLRRLIRDCHDGRALDWCQLVDDVEAARLDVGAWDLIVVGTHYIAHDLGEVSGLIAGDGRQGWLDGLGRVARPAITA